MAGRFNVAQVFAVLGITAVLSPILAAGGAAVGRVIEMMMRLSQRRSDDSILLALSGDEGPDSNSDPDAPDDDEHASPIDPGPVDEGHRGIKRSGDA
jgi:hypothetical protein